MFRDGTGTEQRLDESVRWFRRAAEQGYAKAQEKMASRYAEGAGVGQDKIEALKWAILAAEQRHEGAMKLSASLREELSEAEAAEAERRAGDFAAASGSY